MGAAGLLVGDGEEEQVAARPDAAVDEVAERDRHRRRQVEHVDRAAAPHLVDAVGVRTSSPPNGSRCQPSAWTGTTSVCPIRHRLGAPGSRPSIRATNDARPGVGSHRSIVTPGPSTKDCSTSALRRLLAGVGRAVVDAAVADQRLQQLDGRVHGYSASTMGHLPRGLRASRWPGSPWQPAGMADTDAIEPRSAGTWRAGTPGVEVVDCDPALADTAAFCAAYGYAMRIRRTRSSSSASATRRVYAMCVVLAATRLDVNRSVRKRLGTKKASFASADETAAMTGMAIGGVTPFAPPDGLPIWVDAAVMARERIVVGGGSRACQGGRPTGDVARVPGAEVVTDLAQA